MVSGEEDRGYAPGIFIPSSDLLFPGVEVSIREWGFLAREDEEVSLVSEEDA